MCPSSQHQKGNGADVCGMVGVARLACLTQVKADGNMGAALRE